MKLNRVTRNMLIITVISIVIALCVYYATKKKYEHFMFLADPTIKEERQLMTQGNIGEKLSQYNNPQGRGILGGVRSNSQINPAHASGIWQMGYNTQVNAIDQAVVLDPLHSLHTGKDTHSMNYSCSKEGDQSLNGDSDCCEHVPRLRSINGTCQLSVSGNGAANFQHTPEWNKFINQ